MASGDQKGYTEGSKCAKCKETLGLRAVTIGGVFYHRDCFKCDGCNELLELRFHEVEGKRYCTKCHTEKFAMKCHECKKPLDGALYVIMLDREYHQNCPKCTKCRRSLAGGQYFPHQNKPYCLECHWKVRTEAKTAQPKTSQAKTSGSGIQPPAPQLKK